MPGRTYLEIARRQRHVLVIAAMLAFVAALVVGPLATPDYAASATVRIRPITDQPFAPSASVVDVPTEVEVVRSAAVIEGAAVEVGEPDASLQDVLASLEVEQVGEALALRIRFRSDDPERSARWANALASAYLAERESTAAATVAGLIAAVDQEIEALGPDLGADPAAEQRALELQRRRSDLSTLIIDPGDVLRPAVPPTSPDGPPGWVGQLGVFAVVLLAGAAVAVVADRSDTRVRSAAEVAAVAGPVLAVVAEADEAGLADAARLVRLRLGHSRFGRPWRVLVTSPDVGGPVDALAKALSAELGSAHEVMAEDSVLDAQGLERAASVDAVIVLADAATTDLSKLGAAVEAIENVKAVFAGTVLIGNQ